MKPITVSFYVGKTNQVEPRVHEIKVGTKIFFEKEIRPYMVKAHNDRYAICTKPYNPKRTVLYTIIDFKNKQRAPNWWIFNIYDYKVQADIEQCLKDLETGECELSKRRAVSLDIIEIENN
jgi:hypothetical protein